MGQGWLVWHVSAKGERKLGEGIRSRDEVTGAGRARVTLYSLAADGHTRLFYFELKLT